MLLTAVSGCCPAALQGPARHLPAFPPSLPFSLRPRFVNYADAGAAERARQAMNGMRAGEKILHVMVQTNHSSGGAGGLPNGRQHSGQLDMAAGQNSMAAAAAVLAAAAGQPVLSPPQAEWPLLAPPAGGMMW